MGKNKDTSDLVNGLLRVAAIGALTATVVIAPNALLAFDKPLRKLMDKWDEQDRLRELHKTLRYMKQRGLIRYEADDYEHGVVITAAGQKRLAKVALDDLEIMRPMKWDGQWRLVFFDIPEKHRAQRYELTSKLRSLGFQMLQKSMWIHPFPCRDEVAVLAEGLRLSQYVTYIEISHIDNEKSLRTRFKKLLS